MPVWEPNSIFLLACHTKYLYHNNLLIPLMLYFDNKEKLTWNTYYTFKSYQIKGFK